MSLIYLSCAWLAGVFFGSASNFPLALVFIGTIPLPLLFFTRQHKKLVILSSLCLVAFLGGAFYFQPGLPAVDDSCLQFYNDRGTVEIRGLVDRAPELRDNNTRLHLSAREIILDDEWREVSGTALLFVPRYPEYSYGDVLQVTGKLETPPKFDDFDYEEYLARKGIYSTVFYPEIEVVDTGKGFLLLEWIYSLRNNLSDTLVKILPEPQASLAQGIVLGIRENIPLSVKADFNSTGTAHLLAISGLHLSMVVGILLSLGIWVFGRKGYVYIWLALAAIWLYALLTGMHAPVIRAAIMASLFLAAELLGRQRSAITALAFAAAIMVGISPQILWDASFQMSFAAMAGLIFIFPLVQSLFRNAIKAALGEEGTVVSIAHLITDSLSVSLGAVIAVWPLVAYYFDVISPVAPLATFFALPALSGIIIAGALAGILGLVLIPAAQVIGWLVWLFTSYMLLVVNIFSAIPFIEGSSINANLIWVYYSALALVIWLFKHRRKLVEVMPKADSIISRFPRKRVVPSLLVVAVLVSVTATTLPDNKLHTSFLDVGQGDAIFIQKGSQQILVDGGPSPQEIILALGEEMPFWDRTIDLVILTHPHADHITGLVEVLNRYKVKHVLYPDLEYEFPLYDEWLGLIEEKNIEYTLAKTGQRINFAGVTLEVLNPQTPVLSGTESDTDNNGVVLRLEMGEVSFILTADIMMEAELELVTRRVDLTGTVLKIAHHGSASSTSEEFLAVVSPEIAVISAGKDNPFGHPSDEVTDRLEDRLGEENIYRTDENGTVEFITDGIRLWVKTDSP